MRSSFFAVELLAYRASLPLAPPTNETTKQIDARMIMAVERDNL
jgi:hypothetical protein